MKFVASLTDTQKAALGKLHHQGQTHRQRQRAHAVLLSDKGYTIEQLADIFGADRDTVSGWLHRWHQQGLDALSDAPKAGRRRKIDAALEQHLLELIERPTPDLKRALLCGLQKKGRAFPGTP